MTLKKKYEITIPPERDMTQDKTYVGQVDGIPFRIRAAKRPDKETEEALKAMVKLVYNKKFNDKNN